MGNILNIINSDEHFYNKNRNDYFMKCLTGSFHSSDLQDLFHFPFLNSFVCLSYATTVPFSRLFRTLQKVESLSRNGKQKCPK